MRVRNVCLSEKRRELPGIGNLARFQPSLNGLFAFDPLEFVFEMGRLQRCANFLLALGQLRATIRADGRSASRIAKAREAIAKRCGGAARSRCWIIQLMRQTCVKFTQGREFF